MEQINPTLFDIGLFVVIAAFLLGAVNQVLKIVDHFRAKPPAHEQYVKLDSCKEIRAGCKTALDHRLDNIEEGLKGIDTGDREGRSHIHRDVRKLEDRISKTEGYVETMNQRQISQGGILDNILEKLGKVQGHLEALKK